MRSEARSGTSRRRSLLSAAAVLAASFVLVQGMPAPAQAQGVAEARREAARLSAELADLRDRSAKAIGALEAAEDALGRAVGRSATLTRDLDDARELAGGADAQLQRRVSALYRSGGQLGVWASLLEAQTPADLAARKANVDKIVASDAQRRNDSAAGAERVEVLEDQAQQAASDQIAATGLAEAHAAELNDLMARQQAALERATERARDLIEQERKAAAAAAAAKLAREQAARIAAAQAAAQAAAVAAGSGVIMSSGGGSGTAPSLVTPTTLPTGPAYLGPSAACPVGSVHSFTDTWGAPRSGGRKHQGTDVFAPYGAPAYAVVDGVIDKWSNGGLGGLAVWLKGDDGTRYYYAHNSANLAQVGKRVRAGEVIAFVGTTGNAATTPPHIHFEAHPPGKGAQNPAPWLKAICGR